MQTTENVIILEVDDEQPRIAEPANPRGLFGFQEEPSWGPTGKAVYERTYSRVKPNGERETWAETVARVVDGNLSLVQERYHLPNERELLYDLIYNFRAIPAGRHLWMSGVEGRQFLFNCYVSGWGDKLSEHFAFTFSRLIEGGGVGSNYSSRFFINDDGYPKYVVYNLVELHLICTPDHPDYEELKPYLSDKYNHEYREAHEVEDSREGWTETLAKLIDYSTYYEIPRELPGELNEDVMEFHPLLVVDLSHIREAGRVIRAFGGTSAGPVPFAQLLRKTNAVLGQMWLDGVNGPLAMDLDHAISECIVSGNVRRGARMSIMHWNDPWIEWFLHCKSFEDGLDHWSTNISVEIDDDFINLIQDDMDPEETAKAKKVYRAIVEGMLKNGEPGIWNSSLANVGEPNPVISTNPCGEICLEGWENCNLGHVNLSAFVLHDGSVDYESLYDAHKLMTRFLIRATYGDITYDKTKEINNRNRRIGVGHFGLAGFLAKQGIRFSEAGKSSELAAILESLKEVVDAESIRYSHTLRIPTPVKRTTVAPTGTIAKLCGESEGIHPVYAKYFIRRIRYSKIDPEQIRAVAQFRNEGYRVVDDIYSANTVVVEIPTKDTLVDELEQLGVDPDILQSVDQLSLREMLGLQRLYQELWADNSVSFTINVPSNQYGAEEVMETLLEYLPDLKGTTMMVDESRELAPYERITQEEYEQARAKTVDESYDDNCASGACPVR